MLQKFSIEFTRSDRPIRELAVGAVDDRFFRFELRDRNGGEAFEGRARFVDAGPSRTEWREWCGLTEGTPIVTIRTASARDCRGSCVVAEERNPHIGSCNWARFLTGFSLRFSEPRARKLRMVAVRSTESGRLEATFRNDGDRQLFDVDVGYVDIPIPLPPPRGEYPRFRTVVSFNTSRLRGVRYRGGGRVELNLFYDYTYSQDRYIQAFSVERTGSDEYLKLFSIDVQDEPVTVLFKDNDGREDVGFSVLFSEFVGRIE